MSVSRTRVTTRLGIVKRPFDGLGRVRGTCTAGMPLNEEKLREGGRMNGRRKGRIRIRMVLMAWCGSREKTNVRPSQ